MFNSDDKGDYQLLRCLRAFLNLNAYSSFETHTESTLKAIKSELNRFIDEVHVSLSDTNMWLLIHSMLMCFCCTCPQCDHGGGVAFPQDARPYAHATGHSRQRRHGKLYNQDIQSASSRSQILLPLDDKLPRR